MATVCRKKEEIDRWISNFEERERSDKLATMPRKRTGNNESLD